MLIFCACGLPVHKASRVPAHHSQGQAQHPIPVIKRNHSSDIIYFCKLPIFVVTRVKKKKKHAGFYPKDTQPNYVQVESTVYPFIIVLKPFHFKALSVH